MDDKTTGKISKGLYRRGSRSVQIRYTNNDGHQQRETFKAATFELALNKAERELAIRIGKMAEDKGPVTAAPNRITFEELCGAVVRNYEARGLASKDDIETRFRLHLLPYFRQARAKDLTNLKVWEAYIVHRRDEGAANQTINLELQAARRAFLLAKERDEIYEAPKLSKLLMEDRVRHGIFDRSMLDAVCAHLPAHLAPAVRFAFITGWRHQEVFTRRWRHVTTTAVRIEK